EMDSAEGYYRTDRADLLTPEKLFERRWALTVIDLALNRLEEEFTDKGRGRLFNYVKPFLTEEDGEFTYRQIAAELGMSEGALDPEGFYLASGGEDRRICIWEVPSKDELSRQVFPTGGHELYRWEAHKTTATALTFAPVWGSTLATGGADGTLKLWDILSIRRELETLGLSLRRPIPTLTVIVLSMMGVGYLIMLIGIFTMRLRPAFKRLPPKLFIKIGGPIMLTGMFLPMVVPGVYPWWDYSTPTYIQRLLCVVLGAPLFYLLFAKV